MDTMLLEKDTFQNTQNAISHFKDLMEPDISSISQRKSDASTKAKESNEAIDRHYKKLITEVNKKSAEESWSNVDRLLNLLSIGYAKTIVMIESRHNFRKYHYMDFSRRLGELWEPFCKLCFEFPINEAIESPELISFDEVQELMNANFLRALNLNKLPTESVDLLKNHNAQLMSILTSGDVSTKLDLHFKLGDVHHNVDFKTGFNSNEKGNVNRLKFVASIYKEIVPGNQHCTLFVRSDKNNNYLTKLMESKLWDVYCGDDTYSKIKEYSGFDLLDWRNNHMRFLEDVSSVLREHLEKNELTKYIW